MSITLTNPGELVGLVSTVIGTTPKESVVVVSLRKSGLIGAILRVDLSDLTDPATCRPTAKAIGNTLAEDLAKSATMIVYSDAINDETRVATAHVRSVIAEEYLDGPVDVFRVCGDTVAPMRDNGTEGRPMEIINPNTAHESRVALKPGRYEGTSTERRTSREHQDRWAAKRTTETVIAWRKASHTRFVKAIARTATDGPANAITAGEAGKLIAALSDKRIRDAVLVGLVADEATARGILDGSTDDKVSAAMSPILSHQGGVRPDMAALSPMWQTLVRLDGHATGADRAPLLTLLALLSWWDGDATIAREYLDEVEANDPSYRLAGLLRCTILAGIEPGWTKNRHQHIA